MTLAKYLDERGNLVVRNRLLKFGFVALAVMQGFLTVATIRALRYQRTILVPPVIRSRLEFVGDRASEEYVREFARYVVGLALNVSPHTAKGDFEELLTLYSPKTWGHGKKTLYAMLREIEQAKISTVFYPQRILPDPEGGRIEVRGHRKVYADDLPVESGKRRYVLRYELVDGRFELLGIAETAEEDALEGSIEAAGVEEAER